MHLSSDIVFTITLLPIYVDFPDTRWEESVQREATDSCTNSPAKFNSVPSTSHLNIARKTDQVLI